jgi:hypothetical protein
MEKPKRSVLQRFFDIVSSLIVSVLLIAILSLVVIEVLQFLASDWVASWKPILDPQLVVSIWVAELPLAYFINRILGERVDRPVLEIIRLNSRLGENEREPAYYGVTAWNKGQVMAEDCDISVTFDGLGEFELSWQPPREGEVNIRPDRNQKFEVLRIVPLERNLELPIRKEWGQSYKLGLGNYTGTISIGARNCRPAKRRFRITFDTERDKVNIRLT